ncbi:MAG TPA: glycosyltransferase family 4 protein [Actinomycetota bacterium]|nr:glycosyltransferase family 4 protein [Actinomycetota bacterium]
MRQSASPERSPAALPAPTGRPFAGGVPLDGSWSPLRIGIVAPPWYPIPPKGYGGIEWMIYWLAEALAARGHEVTVIGAGGSRTSANFIPTYEDPPFRRIGESLPEVLHALAAAEALDDLRVDVVHDHCLAGPLTAARRRVPTVLTAHGPLDGEVRRYYEMLSDSLSLVAISDCQRRKAPDLHWAGMVHNAVPVDEYPFQSRKEDFCLFLGRMNAEKAPELAIEVARRAGYPIVIAAKCNEPPEKRYFEERVRPLLGPDAHWFGEANTAQKKDLLARARCLVFPIQWDEPFGIVMVEAMACGTPVVAPRRGSVPEVVEDGVTGFICDDTDELPWAIVKVDELEPKLCRQHVAEHFDVSNMVAGYEAVYRGVARTAPSHERWRIYAAPSSKRLTS